MVKGMTINILSVGLVLIVAIVLYAFFHPLSQPSAAEYARTDMYVMKNAIDSAKAYMDASMDFAVFQAAYDVGKHGGTTDAANSKTYANNLLPAVSCAKTDDRINSGDAIGCIPGEYSCPSDEGEDGYTNEGYHVGLLQFLLNKLGYGPAQADCKFGKATLTALWAFQNKSGIEETGFADVPTLAKLRAAFAYDNCGDYFNGCSNKFLSVWNSAATEETLKANLKAEILKDVNKYTSDDYAFLDLPLVSLPRFQDKGVAVSESGNGLLVSLSGDALRISKKDDKGETIALESPSNYGKTYAIRLLAMFRAAKSEAESLAGIECGKITDEQKTQDGFTIDIKVLSRTADPCKASVKVSVTDASSKKLPVFNGTAYSFEPVRFELVVGIAGGAGPVQSPQSVANKVIVIDPGHGGPDPGASNSAGTLLEKNVNLEIAQKFSLALLSKGASRVILTRTSDSAVNAAGADINKDGKVNATDELLARAKIANDNNADIFISIHANSDPGCTQKGTETFVWCACSSGALTNGVVDICGVSRCVSSNSLFEQNKKLAGRIQPLVTAAINTQNLGVFGADLRVLETPKMPAILIETGFLCNSEDAQAISDPASQEKIAEAATSGLEDYLGNL
jgi:N-acetylmuramoyl-L-alanine amidase